MEVGAWLAKRQTLSAALLLILALHLAHCWEKAKNGVDLMARSPVLK